MPEGVFDVVGIHFAVDLELIESLLEFPCVVQSDPALPKVGFDLGVDRDHFVEIRQGFVDFARAEQQRSSGQVELGQIGCGGDGSVNPLESLVGGPLAQGFFDDIVPASRVLRVRFTVLGHGRRERTSGKNPCGKNPDG